MIDALLCWLWDLTHLDLATRREKREIGREMDAALESGDRVRLAQAIDRHNAFTVSVRRRFPGAFSPEDR